MPLPVVVPPRFHGTALAALHGLSAGVARLWPGGLAYQFVAICAEAGDAGRSARDDGTRHAHDPRRRTQGARP